MTFFKKTLCLMAFFALSFASIKPMVTTETSTDSQQKPRLTLDLAMKSMAKTGILEHDFKPWARRQDQTLKDIATWVNQIKNDYPPQDNSLEAKRLWAEDLVSIIIAYIEKVNSNKHVTFTLSALHQAYIANLINQISSGSEEPQEQKPRLTLDLAMQSMAKTGILEHDFKPWARRQDQALKDIATWVNQIKNDYPPQDNSLEAKRLWAEDLVSIIIAYIEKVNSNKHVTFTLSVPHQTYIANLINQISYNN